MNKEQFVSTTPHETKVGLVEDDLLAEIYLERENEYTLAGSIYKGRVTRVLPGMQSAFVDIGLERDAFLYVSDFMELEEHDEDLTDIVPANRGVQDLRPQTGQSTTAQEAEEHIERPAVSTGESQPVFDQTSEAGEHETQHPAASGAAQGSSEGGGPGGAEVFEDGAAAVADAATDAAMVATRDAANRETTGASGVRSR